MNCSLIKTCGNIGNSWLSSPSQKQVTAIQESDTTGRILALGLEGEAEAHCPVPHRPEKTALEK